MIRNSTKLTALAAFVLLGGATALNCSKGSNTASQGDVQLALVLPDGTTVSSVTYTVLSSSNATITSGTLNVADPNATISLDLSLAPGVGDTVKLTATTSAGVACTGVSAPFNVTAGTTTNVALSLTCGGGGQSVSPGQLGITATLVQGDNCPSITSTVAAPAQTSVGSTISVNAGATDPDSTDTISFSWAPAANFVNPNIAGATYTCTAPGAQTITLTISDGHSPTPCTTSVTMTVNCIAVSKCGNGVVETGEQCDPPNGTTCSATCQIIPPATGGTTGAAGAPATGGTTGAAGAPATGGTTGAAGAPATGGTTGTGGATGAAGAGGTVDACTQCEFTGAATSAKTKICTGVNAPGGGTSTANFGCNSLTGAAATNCLALLTCLQSAACQTAIANATPDFGEANVGFDDPTPCLCGSLDDNTCLGGSSFPGVCGTQYIAAAGGATLVTGPFFSNTSPVGIANNLMTCDIDDTACTSACTGH